MSTKCAFGNRNANFHALQVSGVPLRNRRVLEIGCGNGYLGEYVRSLGATVVGCEITLPATAPDVQFVQADGAALPFGQQFDVVMSFDVLEHIPDTDQHLREVRRVLRPARSTVVNDVVMSRRRSDDVLHVERRCRRPSAAIRATCTRRSTASGIAHRRCDWHRSAETVLPLHLAWGAPISRA